MEDDFIESDDYILHSPHNRPQSIGNEDWLIDPPKDRDFNLQKSWIPQTIPLWLYQEELISDKLEILELATGKKDVEEWSMMQPNTNFDFSEYDVEDIFDDILIFCFRIWQADRQCESKNLQFKIK